MEQLPSNLINTAAIKGGTGKISAPAQAPLKPQAGVGQAPSQSPSTTVTPSLPRKENGVTSVTTSEGFLSQTSDSGVSVLQTPEGQRISLPSGHQFELSEQGVQSLNELGAGATLTRTEEGLQLISFQDQEGNTVQVDPESLTYEVMNKQKNLSQVFLPDGHQQVVAFGQFHDRESGKISRYQHEVLLDPQGEVVANNGFKDFGVEGKKLSFSMGNTRIERSLVKPLPGQPPFAPAQPSGDASASSEALNPLSIFGEQPLAGASGLNLNSVGGLGTGSVPLSNLTSGGIAGAAATGLNHATIPPNLEEPPAPAESAGTESAPSVAAAAAEPQDPALAEFQALPNIDHDFYAGAGQEGLFFDETPSGVVMRSEGNSRAFLLPNGDAFRTDGMHLELIGENPRASNARIVVEGESQLLAYSDPEGNHHQLDINNGDYSVSNRQGTLTQGVRADGTKEYTVRGTYTSEAGSPVQYAHKATFGAGGTLVSKEGFDDLRISGDRMAFTLPNGVETDRKLIQDAGHEVNIAKKFVPTAGFADEWGAGLALADQLLSGQLPAGDVTTPPVEGTSATPPGQSAPPEPGRPTLGLVRQPLPEGGTVSTLPNGIRFFDTPQGLTATDPSGQPLPVQRTEISTESGESYLMTVTSAEGVGYTIASNNNDIMVQSADGKVHQLVGETGSVFTSIMDNGNQHLIEKDPFKGITCSPGTRLDPRFPDRVFVDGPMGSYHYQVPHPFAPLPPHGELPPNGRIPGTGAVASGTPISGGARGPGGATQAEGVASPAEGIVQDSADPTQDPGWQDRGPSPESGFMAGPGGTATGFRPNFWQRLKGAFTGDNPWDPATGGFDQRQMYGGNPYSAPYPGSYQQFDPVGHAQWAQFSQQYNAVQMTNMAMQSMTMMSMLFYSPMGMFW